MPSKILICGAGIAGCCLAWWLERSGHSVTVVEQAPEARGGGYVIDFWGLGFDVAEKMGLLGELRQHDLDVHEFEIVDRTGRKISGFNQGALKDLTRGRIMSLPRSAVALSLYHAIKDRVPVRFGDSIADLSETEGGVDVTFGRASPERFDLVVGADGLHSAVRRLVFGNEPSFERFLGYCVAAFSAPRLPASRPAHLCHLRRARAADLADHAQGGHHGLSPGLCRRSECGTAARC